MECATCSEWFHTRCAGLSHARAAKLDSYECASCARRAGRDYPPDWARGVRRKLVCARAPLETARQLLAAADALPCAVPEAAVLRKAIEHADAWTDAAIGAVLAAAAAGAHGGARSGALNECTHVTDAMRALPPSCVDALIKSGTRLRVAPLLWAALGVRQWAAMRACAESDLSLIHI